MKWIKNKKDRDSFVSIPGNPTWLSFSITPTMTLNVLHSVLCEKGIDEKKSVGKPCITFKKYKEELEQSINFFRVYTLNPLADFILKHIEEVHHYPETTAFIAYVIYNRKKLTLWDDGEKYTVKFERVNDLELEIYEKEKS